MQKLIQKGNAKLAAANMYMFNLPATKQVCGKTCPGCYAAKEQVRFPAVLIARENRFEASKTPQFTDTIKQEIGKLKTKPKYFRIHSSGDFYSQSYVDSWESIAKEYPSTTFYAYTKRMRDYDFSRVKALSNFILIDSLQYKRLNYGTLEEAPAEVFICPNTKGSSTQCGVTCTYCMTKDAEDKAPYFIKH